MTAGSLARKRTEAQVGVRLLPHTSIHTPASISTTARGILCISAETHISTTGFQGDGCAAVILYITFQWCYEDSIVKCYDLD